jgi:hypothetical protein
MTISIRKISGKKYDIIPGTKAGFDPISDKVMTISEIVTVLETAFLPILPPKQGVWAVLVDKICKDRVTIVASVNELSGYREIGSIAGNSLAVNTLLPDGIIKAFAGTPPPPPPPPPPPEPTKECECTSAYIDKKSGAFIIEVSCPDCREKIDDLLESGTYVVRVR